MAPFGYRYDPEQKLLLVFEEEASLVRQIFDRYASRRWGSARIALWLNDRARTTRRGHRWTLKPVLDILRNPTYAGRLPFNGNVFEGGHERIVDEELFQQAQELLLERGEDYPRRSSAAPSTC